MLDAGCLVSGYSALDVFAVALICQASSDEGKV
jgi:hypothetical protein